MEEKATIRAMYYQADHEPMIKEIPNTVEGIQDAVGGYFECVRLNQQLLLVCDEDGGMKHNAPSVVIKAHMGLTPIVGNCFVCSVSSDGSEFEDLTDELQSQLINYVHPLFSGK